MSRQLPSRPNLEYLRKQAKELLEELQRQDSSAQLADAQVKVAPRFGVVLPAGETVVIQPPVKPVPL